jgi:protein-tyrosine kinase
MSRIEEALKRARESATGGVPALPSVEVFQDPWAVSDTAAAESATPVGQTAPTPEHVASQEPPDAHDGGPPANGGAPAARAMPQLPDALALFQGFSSVMAEKIVATPDIRPVFAEQYRKLAGSLHHTQLNRSLKVLMVTSAMAGEGKSLTATNLALTFSESYRRTVLLIDADLRRPTLHETFQVPNVSGLGDGLRAESEQKLSLIQVSPRLTLLTAGRPDPDPMSSLTSERMRRVIEEASSRFDWVIVDTPPVGVLPDAKLLASMADGILLVVHAGKTAYTLVQRAVAALGRERILGVVLNQADERAGHAGYSYYDYYGSDRGK